MSWFSRLSLIISCVVLSACGFEPVYGTNGSGNGLRGAILADNPDTRREFSFVEQFEKRVGRAPAPSYTMTYAISVEETGLAITGSNDITRYNLIGRSVYEIKNASTGEVILEGSVNGFTAYSASEQPVATLSSQEDAETRLMVILADKIVTRLLASSGQLTL